MQFEFTEEQHAVADTMRSYLSESITPAALKSIGCPDSQWSSGVSEALWRGIRDLGLLDVAIDAVHGGAGGSVIDLIRIAEVVGETLAPLPLLGTAFVAPAVLGQHAELAAVAELFRAISTGVARVGALTDGASLVPYGAELTHLLAEAAPDDEPALWLLRASDFVATPVVGQDARSRFARIVRTPGAGTLIAQGATAADTLRAAAWTASALEGVGVAEALLERTCAYVGVRRQFGRPVGSFQAVKHQLANLAMHVEAARSLAWRAAYSLTAGGDMLRWAHTAQGSVTETLGMASDVALQLHGGIGFTREADVHLWLHAAEALAVRHGTTEMHRLAVGRTQISAR